MVTGKLRNAQLAMPKTLWLAHELLMKMRPARDAPATKWLRYYRQSAAIYAEVAEIDRGHHHEAMYWANRERKRANELAAELAKTIDQPVIETVKEKPIDPETTVHTEQ
jgi:hypothetical protein